MVRNHSRIMPSGPMKLSQDLSKLVNNRQSSDVKFLVGGGKTHEDMSSTVDQEQDGSEAVVMYGHSVILRCRSRYFATMFEGEKEWKESLSGVLHKPNISPVVFHALLFYIYTGSLECIDRTYLLELIAAAEEMELEELSIDCQMKVMAILRLALFSEAEKEDDLDEDDDGDELGYTNMRASRLPVSLAIRTLLIPALVLAFDHSLSDFFQKLLDFTSDHIETILAFTDARTAFLDRVPQKIFIQILASNSLPLPEFDIWELAVDWACYQIKALKPAVESQLRLNIAAEKDEENDTESLPEMTESNGDESDMQEDEQTIVSVQQLKAVKTVLAPLIKAIRFTLIDPAQYASVVDLLTYFLPTRRFIELHHFFSQPDKNLGLDVPRRPRDFQPLGSKIAEVAAWKQLKRWIIDAKGIKNCRSTAALRFRLLFRASVDGFLASVFHQKCDNQGPTLLLVKSIDGHLFGGVNFNRWTSAGGKYSHGTSNFLFALMDGKHRQVATIFKITDPNHYHFATVDNPNYGPIFGHASAHDLVIYDKANVVKSTSKLPNSYNGPGATNVALAGAQEFFIADYEIFAISVMQ